MEKEIDALTYAKRYYSAVKYYEEDPYYAEDAAYYRRMTIVKLRKIHDSKTKKKVKLILKTADKILKNEKKDIINRLSRISSMDKNELNYLKRI
ncbi:hypothetical protein [Marinitoga litoralis]|jgi:hypothetical protein|uniref:hypothetical protein n=1 Tax=Marinitoga litoralis TaxID=570855 RepID=UPI001960EC09|nr:hypothetical protein [Marinitoga litoralis]MBM7559733.1 hypothetical protein [Marinitoga litoralis]